MYPHINYFNSNQKNKTLLVAGGEVATCRLLQVYLQPFQVLTTSSYDQALCMILQFVPSLVISDLDMGGLKLCEQLKNDPHSNHIPIILFSAQADMETKIQSLNTGADDLISPPIHAQELQARVRNLIFTRLKIRESLQRQIQLESSEPIMSREEKFLQQATKAVLDNMSNPSFGVNQLAREVCKSNSQLYRELLEVTGQSPNTFIQHIRLLQAANLIRQKAGNISDVAYRVGFNNLSYFAKCFKTKFRVSPSHLLFSSEIDKTPIKKAWNRYPINDTVYKTEHLLE